VRGETARRMVRLYPRAWRERYEEEFVAMLEQGPVTIKDLFDVVFGAVDAWLSPQVVYEGRLVMVSRMRGSVLAVLWAWVGLVVAGVGFRKMTEYDDFVRAARDSALVGVAFDTVVVGAVVALAAVAVGGAPVAFAALRKALAERRKDVLLLCMPLIFGAGFVGYILVLMKVIYPALGRVAVHGTVRFAQALILSPFERERIRALRARRGPPLPVTFPRKREFTTRSRPVRNGVLRLTVGIHPDLV
jgi:predicted membrane protein